MCQHSEVAGLTTATGNPGAAMNEAEGGVLVISASVSLASRSEKLGEHVAGRLRQQGFRTDHLSLRTLPAAPLLAADTQDPAIAQAVAGLERAAGVVIVTPTYKGTFTGLLKVFVDLLPQYALRGKTVLPLATGGTLAHALMLDHGLRPMLQTMWPKHVAQGCFMLDKQMVVDESGALEIQDDALLTQVLDGFQGMMGPSMAA